MRGGKLNMYRLYDVTKDAISKFDKDADMEKVYEAIVMIDEASYKARHEGLLALECNYAYKQSKSVMDDIAFGVLMVIDATEPEFVRDALVNDYWANEYEGNNAIKQVILLRGILMIQQGYNPRLIESILLSMIPSEFREEATTRLEKRRTERKAEEHERKSKR